MERWQATYLAGLAVGLLLGYLVEPHLGAAFIILYILGAEMVFSTRAQKK